MEQQHVNNTTGWWKPYLALVIFAFVLYSNTLNHFFALDDEYVVTKNRFTQQGIKGIPDIFRYDTFVGHFTEDTDTREEIHKKMKLVAGGRYRPLSLFTFALEVEFFGKTNTFTSPNYKFKGNAFVGHLNNILLYLFTTCLLYLILCRLFSSKRDEEVSRYARNDKWYLSFPFIVSVLFLAHPIHTEAIANVKGRDEIMVLLFLFAALWFTIKYFDTNKRHHLLLSGLSMFLALLSKENAITFLAVIPITIYYFILRPSSKKGVKSTLKNIGVSMIPLITAAALFLLIRACVLGENANTSVKILNLMNNPFADATKDETIATIFYTLLLYVKLLFFPHPLTWDYYPHHIQIVNWSNPVAIVSLLFYLGIIIYAIYGLKPPLNPPSGGKSSPYGGVRGGRTVISYSIWLYILPLTIVSNLFFPIGVFMGERFVFISSVGFCIFLGWLIYNYLPKLTKNIKVSTYLTSFVLIIILCLFSVKTISRNMAWKNNLTLYTTDVKTSKNSAKGSYLLGQELLLTAVYPRNEHDAQKKDGLCDDAAKYLKRSIELYPRHVEAIKQFGFLHIDCYKDVARCLHYCTVALWYDISMYSSIATILQQVCDLDEHYVVSNPDEILQSCDQLLELEPNFGEVYYIKGIIYGKHLNDIELSLVNLEKALSLDFPKPAKFYAYLGTSHAMSANYEKALQYLLKAVEIGTSDYNTYRNIGTIYEILGDMDNANLYMKKGAEIKGMDKSAN